MFILIKNRIRTLLSIQFLLILIIICSFLIQINSLVIYRRKTKPKLICHEEELPNSSSASTQIDEAAEFFLRNNMEFKKTTKSQKNRNKRSQTINNKNDSEFIINIDKEPALNLVVSFSQFLVK